GGGRQPCELEGERTPGYNVIGSEALGMVEGTLVPRSRLVGQRGADLACRDKYGLALAAIWRKGEAIRSDLDDHTIELGDAMLLIGPREKLQLLERDQDFLVLTPLGQRPIDTRKAPVAGAIMLGVVIA